MAIDSVDKFSTAQDRLETAMDLLKAIEQIADADSSGRQPGIRAVALARFEHLLKLWARGISPEDRRRAPDMLDEIEAKFLAEEAEAEAPQ